MGVDSQPSCLRSIVRRATMGSVATIRIVQYLLLAPLALAASSSSLKLPVQRPSATSPETSYLTKQGISRRTSCGSRTLLRPSESSSSCFHKAITGDKNAGTLTFPSAHQPSI